MPSQTFLNLPISKQQVLISAAKNEFTRVLLTDASINQIIKEANISRGSFYMYFKDKEDIYFYLLEQNRQQFFNVAKDIFKKNNGDLITGFNIFFEYLVSFCLSDENKSFFKNVLMNVNFKNEYPIFSKYSPEKMEKELECFLESIDYSNLNIDSKDDIIDILNMIMMLTIHNLVKIVKKPESVDLIQNKYKNQLRMLKQGIYIK
jgi:AcrR family transcriptional regulator